MVEAVSRITVRPAIAADLSALGRLGALLMELHHDLDPRRFIRPTERTPGLYAAFLDKQRQRDDAVLLVADSAGLVTGYAYATLEGPDYMALRGPAGVLQDIVVDPAHRRLGTGRRLIDAMRTQLASRHVPQLVLSTAARNEDAQRLFTGLGFRPTMIEMTLDMDG